MLIITIMIISTIIVIEIAVVVEVVMRIRNSNRNSGNTTTTTTTTTAKDNNNKNNICYRYDQYDFYYEMHLTNMLERLRSIAKSEPPNPQLRFKILDSILGQRS